MYNPKIAQHPSTVSRGYQQFRWSLRPTSSPTVATTPQGGLPKIPQTSAATTGRWLFNSSAAYQHDFPQLEAILAAPMPNLQRSGCHRPRYPGARSQWIAPASPVATHRFQPNRCSTTPAVLPAHCNSACSSCTLCATSTRRTQNLSVAAPDYQPFRQRPLRPVCSPAGGCMRQHHPPRVGSLSGPHPHASARLALLQPRLVASLPPCA